MKKPLYLFVCCWLIAFLLSCETPQIKPIQGELLITAGERYGCDIVFWLDGFGLCYDLGDRWTNDPTACSITLGESATDGRELVSCRMAQRSIAWVSYRIEIPALHMDAAIGLILGLHKRSYIRRAFHGTLAKRIWRQGIVH